MLEQLVDVREKLVPTSTKSLRKSAGCFETPSIPKSDCKEIINAYTDVRII